MTEPPEYVLEVTRDGAEFTFYRACSAATQDPGPCRKVPGELDSDVLAALSRPAHQIRLTQT